MKVPVEWLREFLELGHPNALDNNRLADRLTMAGLEVEETHGSGDDLVFVTKVTPNRGDWLSLYGVAREAAAALGLTLAPMPKGSALDIQPLAGAHVDVRDPQWCPRFTGAMIRGVQDRRSPDFIQKRLTLAGMRPLNAIVDVTNYVMLELGQPLHAYDYDKLPSGEIIVRTARAGEVLTTLDGTERALTPDILVIADQDRPIGLAGLMGGSDSEVTAATQNIFLEAAHFDPGIVRRAAKSLGLSTEASYRFERYVDPALAPLALARAAQMIAEHAGGEVIPGHIDEYPTPLKPRVIAVRPERVNALLGSDLTPERIALSLAPLGLDALPGASLEVVVPTFRPDLTQEIDLVEEVGRMVGYENLPSTLPPARGDGGKDSLTIAFDGRLRQALIGQGLTEAYNHTLGGPSPLDDPALESQKVRVRLALSAELSGLRQSLLPHLMDNLALNVRRKQSPVRLFEIGKVFEKVETHDYSERRSVAAVVIGEGLDYFSVKGIVENLCAALNLSPRFQAAERQGMHPNRTASLSFDGTPSGFVAELDPDFVTQRLDLPQGTGRVSCFELDASLLRALSAQASRHHYQPPPKYPAVVRDLAMVFSVSMPYGEIEQVTREAAGELLESLALLSVYTGERVSEGQKSVALRLTLRADDRTLTEADSEALLSAVRTALQQQLGGEQR